MYKTCEHGSEANSFALTVIAVPRDLDIKIVESINYIFIHIS